ncbi:redoxin domain-containing protein [Lutimonas saemankumensis]|uniref:peroxiredoxin n=1 Tax=Lutimonas saemankumensis TaxID=483016 RepID=UPI001CD3E082|nr:redoxin domain-containing protein [Lutimonas saemankumensis]MCA0932035.1 redoxin domain-containing protein [Lutimonas saemankumensis]
MMKKASLVILVIVALIGIFSIFSSKAQTPVQVGDQVPSFKLEDQNGDMFDLSAFKGNTAMVIYFYPKDDTPGCTKEACSFRDSYETFTDKNIKVIGISSDDVESHKNFAEKYNLPFTLLADTENRVRDLFGVKANAFGLIPGRVTYVIDKEGEIIFMYQSQFQAKKHIEEALKAINSSL